jgi:hypothetical protein
MPQNIEASDGDTLCGLAIRSGFLNCTPIRAANAGKDFLTRPLRQGDSVTIPDLRNRKEGRATNQLHRFNLRRTPEPAIRFVHGSSDKPAAGDDSLSFLNISNYITNQAGANGTAAFPGTFGFQADGHADPDTFKVEVLTPDGGGTLQVTLQALRPVYAAEGSVQGHVPFTGADLAARTLHADCSPVAGAPKRYRSRYLRLVTDPADQAAVAAQTLLVTDVADGLGGANDQMEILDQCVRASYPLPGCQAAPNVCTVQTDIPVGRSRQRVRMAVHVFRTTPGGAAVGGLTEQMIRRRVAKWFRRAYAQANLAPKLVAPAVEFVDPPPANLLTVSEHDGLSASGVTAAGKPSTLSFRLGAPPGGIVAAIRSLADPTVRISLAANQTPVQVAAAIIAALPSGYAGQAFPNATATTALNPSCDLIVTKADGSRVMIRGETTDDTSLHMKVARINLAAVDATSEPPGAMIPSTIDARCLIRSAAGAEDHLNFYVVGAFSTTGLRGRAYVAATDLAAPYQPPAPLRWAVIMASTSGSGPVMDGGDNLPFTFPHDAGHVLNDAFHSDNADPLGPTELMSGAGTSPSNAINATKRICDAPVQVRYAMFDPAQPTPGAAKLAPIYATQRMRSRGAHVTDPW